MSTPAIGNAAQQISYEELPVSKGGAPPIQLKGKEYGDLDGYYVDTDFKTGGKPGTRVYALRHPVSGDIVIASRGTNESQDWSDNIGNLGYRQFAEVQSEVSAYLARHKGSQITFAGHSLGGAISQYLAYDYAKKNPELSDNINLYTFNGLGGLNALAESEGGYDSAVLADVNAIHYYNREDPVSRLGGGHVGGRTIEVPDPRPGPDGLLRAHDRGQHTNASLAAGKPGTPDYYSNSLTQTEPERFIDFINAYGQVLSGGPPSFSELAELLRSAANLPLDESTETARLLADVFSGLRADAENFVSDTRAEAIRVARAGMDRVVDHLIDAAQRKVESVGNRIQQTAEALIRMGEVGRDLLGYFASALDFRAAFLGGVSGMFADALMSQLVRLIDPIVLDLDGNGIELTGRLNSNIYFDMDGDGIKERTGWVSPKDGLLAIDENANGKIDNINELIGDLGRSGFTELSAYDLNKDKLINSGDAAFAKLRVWIDANSNAITDTGELRALPSLNIKSIDLNFTLVDFTAEGNKIHEKSEFQYTNGVAGLAADIWFDVDNVATNSAVSLTGNLTIDGLPDIRGRGDVGSLRSAMVKDGALATLVSGFVTKTAGTLGNARSETEQVLYRWAGVQSVNPASRGGAFDGRKLAALERFMGTPFLVQGVANPNAQAAVDLTQAWDGLVDGVMARLLMGGPVGNALKESIVYSPEIDRLLTGKNPEEMLAALKAAAPMGDSLAVAGYWAAVLPLARETYRDVGGNPESADFTGAISAALADTGLAPFTDLIRDGIVSQGAISGVFGSEGIFRLTSGNDSLWLGDGRRAVFGGDGHDIVALAEEQRQSQLLGGGAGNDQLYTGSANDWLDGGTGIDTMAGSDGNDTYVVDNAGDVVLEEVGEGEDQVRSSVAYTLGANLEHLTLLGSALTGTGNAVANRIIGNNANNRLEGLAGTDTLDGGAGNDTMAGGVGQDYYRVDSAGDVVVETGGDEDTVESSINYTLGLRLEHLVLVGNAANGTGNALDNRIFGNALGNLLNGGLGQDAMYGGAGNDTYLVDHVRDHVGEESGAGVDLVRSSVDYTLRENVEDLVLTGLEDAWGEGNGLANRLTGNVGHNWLNGYAGADTMSGGAGDDDYVVESSGDVVVEAANAGTDQVMTSLAAYTLGANVERLRLFIGDSADSAHRNGTGNALHNEIVGNGGNNRLTGLDGNDTLDGGAGTDTMEGGTGNDRYVVDQAKDLVVELANAGTDTVESKISWVLADHFENLVLTSTGWGVQTAGTGNALNNHLAGSSGNNALDGRGGRDTMIGGEGDDTYTVDNIGDVVTEWSGQGQDEVRSALSYTLGDNLEHLTLLGTAALNGTGNAAANRIIGNNANNRLDGLAGDDTLDGGAGNDTMIGGTGSDYYFVNSAGDVVVETGSGEDTVESTLDYVLGARLENLRLTGTTALRATGNELNNELYGSSLANVLDGRSGADMMAGGSGNDTYVVDNGWDRVVEAENAGDDLVRSSVDFDLGYNLENLELTGLEEISGAGNTLANRITGNAMNNLIDGGAGADTMIGGAGDDTYVVDNTADVVSEVDQAGNDQIRTVLSSYDLARNPFVERLQLFIDSWDNAANRTGLGNALNNELVGNAGNNRLDGRDGNDTLHGNSGADSLYGGNGNDSLDGGAGVDRMEGGTGNDTYVVDQVADFLVEAANAGTDTVESSVSCMLSANFENLTLTNGSGWSVPAIDGQGNSSNNRLIGNSANNALDGGLGVDTMVGGLGNDTYSVDNVGDVVFELQFGGIDEVRSSVSHTLGAFTENLTLTASSNVNATGNVLRNVIKGNAAANRLTGMVGNDSLSGESGHDTLTGCADLVGGGRAEIDTLTGGSGKDVFVLGSAAGVFYDDGDAASNGRQDYALITDFTVGEDSHRLRGAAKDYFLGASGEFWNEPGRGLYRDTNTNSSLDGSDELIAIIRSSNSTALTAANTVSTAQFV